MELRKREKDDRQQKKDQVSVKLPIEQSFAFYYSKQPYPTNPSLPMHTAVMTLLCLKYLLSVFSVDYYSKFLF